MHKNGVKLVKIKYLLKFLMLLQLFISPNLNAASFLKIDKSIYSQKELNFIKQKKILNVKIEKDWAPKDSLEFPNIYPYLKKYMEIIVDKLGWKIKYADKNANDFDLIAALKIEKSNKKRYIFSRNSIFELTMSLVKVKDGKSITLEDLNNKRVALVQGCHYIPILRKYFPDITLIECATNLDALKFVLRKKADAAFGNFFVMSYLIDKNFLSGLSISIIKDNNYIKNIPEYMAFNKNDKLLRDIIDKTINSIDKEEFYLLKEKWLKSPKQKRVYLTDKEKMFLRNHIVTVNTTTTWLPINAKDKNGHIVGIGIDYWKLIAKKAGIRYRFIESKDFATVLNNIKNRVYDLNMATSKTIDKERFAIFSKVYEKFPIAIATLKSKHFIINGVALEGKKVAVGENYSTYYLLKNVYPDISFVLTKNTKEALKLVEEKKVFAAVDTEPVLRYQIIYNNFKNIDITGITGVDFNLQIMLRNDRDILQKIINKSINIITNKERIAIYKKWMGLKKKSVTDYTIIWQITLFFIVVIALILYAYTRQKKLKIKIEKLNSSLQEKIEKAVEKSKKDQLIMMQQSRLAQMGEAISMIAHQWRQPLNSLSLLISTMVAKYNNNNLTKESVDSFEKKSKNIISQMSKTIDDFRSFFKPEKERVKFSLEEVVDNSIYIINPILKKSGIDLDICVKENHKVIGYPNELMQVIINIVNNAKDALENNKKGNKKIFIKVKRDNKKVMLIISNNGAKIPQEYLGKIFEPYFSTKNEKNGTGLGLYMTKLIVEEHMDGKIEVESNEDETKFIITLGGANE